MSHIDALIDSVRRKRRADLESARHVYNLMTSTEANYEDTNRALFAAGLSPFSQSWYSRLKITYEEWMVKRGYREEDLEGIGLTKLYLIKGTPPEEADRWLALSTTVTDIELKEALKESERETPLKEPWVSIRVPESVHGMLEGALLNVRNSVKSNLSMTQFLERAAFFFAESSAEFIAKLMKAIEDGQ